VATRAAVTDAALPSGGIHRNARSRQAADLRCCAAPRLLVTASPASPRRSRDASETSADRGRSTAPKAPIGRERCRVRRDRRTIYQFWYVDRREAGAPPSRKTVWPANSGSGSRVRDAAASDNLATFGAATVRSINRLDRDSHALACETGNYWPWRSSSQWCLRVRHHARLV